jgi:hypothetical protein
MPRISIRGGIFRAIEIDWQFGGKACDGTRSTCDNVSRNTGREHQGRDSVAEAVELDTPNARRLDQPPELPFALSCSPEAAANPWIQ